MSNMGSQSNSKHAQNISIHTVILYFTSSFNDSFIQDSVETYMQEIINEGTTRMILIMPLNVWASDFW